MKKISMENIKEKNKTEEKNKIEQKEINKENKINIKLDNFEGPLELLCFLIDKNKMDITEISITEIANEYLEIINSHKKYNMEIGSDFIKMASRLVYIKSKELLPKDKEEVEETKEELIRKIIEYRKYKENLPQFINAYDENSGRVMKNPEEIQIIQKKFEKKYELEELTKTYTELYENIKNRKNENSKNVEKLAIKEKFSVKKIIKNILNIFKSKTKIIFNKMFNINEKPKGEVIAGFLGILELSKKEKINIEQKENFDEITIKKKSQ